LRLRKQCRRADGSAREEHRILDFGETTIFVIAIIIVVMIAFSTRRR
jgi:hypothetical protein